MRKKLLRWLTDISLRPWKIPEAYRGQGYGSYLVKSVVNQLIAQNDEAFQIVVEDSNIGAKRLYENIGFVKQTQVVYLK